MSRYNKYHDVTNITSSFDDINKCHKYNDKTKCHAVTHLSRLQRVRHEPIEDTTSTKISSLHRVQDRTHSSTERQWRQHPSCCRESYSKDQLFLYWFEFAIIITNTNICSAMGEMGGKVLEERSSPSSSIQGVWKDSLKRAPSSSIPSGLHFWRLGLMGLGDCDEWIGVDDPQ